MPFEPPFDQRSCCHTPTRCAGFVGSTATDGSTSTPAKFIPRCVPMQPGSNGLCPDTRTSDVNGS